MPRDRHEGVTRAFTNWSGEQRATPRRWEEPASEREVLAALDRARQDGMRLRPVGSGHSWSAVAKPEEVALTLARMDRVLAIDAAAGTATVQGGVRLSELSDALDAVGLAMPILGSIGAQTVAGAVSTGTHGSSLTHGNLSSLITRLRIAVPGRQAAMRELAPGSPELEAARVSLGALGVITELTLRVVPAFRLVETVERIAPESAGRRLRDLAQSAPFVKLWWLPGSGPMHVFRYAPTQLAPRERPVARWIDQRVVNDLVFPGVLAAAARWPSWVGPVNRVVARTYLDHPRAPIARSDRAFHVAMPPRHFETEYAFGFESAGAVLDGLVEATRRAGFRVTFPLEVRFVAGDDGWLSPAHGGPVVQIGAYTSESPDRTAYFGAFEQLAQAHAGRPHWGKTCAVDAAYVRKVLPKAGAFGALRRAWDPSGVLGSPHLDALLGN